MSMTDKIMKIPDVAAPFIGGAVVGFVMHTEISTSLRVTIADPLLESVAPTLRGVDIAGAFSYGDGIIAGAIWVIGSQIDGDAGAAVKGVAVGYTVGEVMQY